MINLTDRPILLDQKFSDKNIRNAITAVLQELERRYGVEPPNVVWSHQQFAFQWYFRPLSLKAKAIFDDSFIQCIYDFAMATANKPIIQFNKNMCRYSLAKPAPAHATRYLRLGCKLLLVYLWSKRKLLLPTIFTPGPGFQPHIEDNELYGYVSCFERYKDEDKLKRQIFYYMPHVLWATDWNRVEDLTLGEFSQLHRAQITFRAGVTSHAFSPSPIPWTGFLQELTNDYPSRVSFGREELVTYSNWVTHRRVVTHSLAEFAELENVVVAKKKIKNQASSKQANKKKVAKKSPSSTHAEKIFGLAKEGSHDSALQYFKTYESTHRNGIDWLEREGFYKGREHIDIRLYSSVWIKVFKSYIHHRVEVKGFEAKKAVLSALNLLADYLFLYLPWWKEIYSNSMIEIPIRPRDFTRYPFISSSTDEPESVLPKTFGEILKLRRPSPATRREALLMIRRFFDYVALQYADNEDIAGHRFRNPISKEFDVPTSKKRTKTNKVPFEKNTYGYVLYYGYALEAFGQYLQELCFSRGLSQNRRELINARWFDAEEFGFVPFVRYRNNIIPVKEVPNVYSWTTRKFFQNNGQSVEFFVPHLTQLRLIVSGIEVGLRFMGLKWLDRRTWDKDNPKSPDLSQFAFVPMTNYTFTLHVNTDKVKEEAWSPTVVFRVRSLLLREQNFQLSIDEENMDKEVMYENRESTRFYPIVPLFRSAISPKPVEYDDYWLKFMTGFQQFFTSVSVHYTQFVKLGPILMHGESGQKDQPKVDIKQDGDKCYLYCPLSVTTVNTPHACRATFSTNRQGILELSDIAELIGHGNTAATEYYQRNRVADLADKLERSDAEMLSGFGIFDSNNEQYLRPDKPESALAKSFKRDREGTIKTFGFMPSASLWSTKEKNSLENDGSMHLRTAPMSLIRFRETHICPVGEECPDEVVQEIGAPKRCGICPLAMKCIDHLPAILAKKHAMDERIKYLVRECESLRRAGEIAAADTLYEEINLETNEYMGWKLSAQILSQIHRDRIIESGDGYDEVFYHVERPDIVRHHLELVSRDTSTAEFLLRRIAESNAYPSLQSPQIQVVASRIRNKLLAGKGDSDLLSIPGPDDVSVVASLLKTVMKAKGLSLSQVAHLLEENPLYLTSSQQGMLETTL